MAIFGVSLQEGNNCFGIHYMRRLRQEVVLLHLNHKIETQQLSYELRTKFRLEGTYRGLCRVFLGGQLRDIQQLLQFSSRAHMTTVGSSFWLSRSHGSRGSRVSRCTV